VRRRGRRGRSAVAREVHRWARTDMTIEQPAMRGAPRWAVLPCVALVVGLALLGCAGEEPPGGVLQPFQPAVADAGPPDLAGEGVLVQEPADVQLLRLGTADHDRCSPEDPCEERYQLQPDGQLLHLRRGRTFEGRVPADDLAPLLRLASSASLIESLRKQPGCPAQIHGGELVEIEVVPGIFVSAETSGCSDGPVAALRYRLRTVARKLFPESVIEPGRAVPDPEVLTRYVMQERLVFGGIWLQRAWGPCPPGTTCVESTSAEVRHGIVDKRGGSQPRGQFSGVTDFEPLASMATRPDVLAEMRKPLPCGVADDLTESIQLYFNGSLLVRAGTAGCSAGPIADLRASLYALITRLAAIPTPDAGAADHPPDLAGP
jgi:hypothetical protein